MTREEFAKLVSDAVHNPYIRSSALLEAERCILDVWDAQAAEVKRLTAEVEALRAALAMPSREQTVDDVFIHAMREEEKRLRAEVERMRTGVPLTTENAGRARVVEVVEQRAGQERRELFTCDYVWGGPAFWGTSDNEGSDATELIARGATVLAWRKP